MQGLFFKRVVCNCQLRDCPLLLANLVLKLLGLGYLLIGDRSDLATLLLQDRDQILL